MNYLIKKIHLQNAFELTLDLVTKSFFNFRSRMGHSDIWCAYTEPDEIQYPLSTSGKLFYPYITSTKVGKI